MKKVINWFTSKSEKRKIIALRLLLATLLAIIFWIFFLLLGKSLVDHQNTEKFLEDQDWLKFIRSDIRVFVINQYGNFILGVFVAILGYKIFAGAAAWIVRKYFMPKYKFDIVFQSAFPSLPHPEFVYLLPGMSYGCRLLLKNKSDNLKINSIGAVGEVVKDVVVDHVERNHITQIFNWLRFEAQEEPETESGKGLAWNAGRAGVFKMNESFTLQPHEQILLPEIYLTADEKDLPDLQDYVNNMDLSVTCQVIISANDERVTLNLSAPLRILTWDDEELMVKGIDEMPAGSKNTREDFLRFANDVKKNDAGDRAVAIQLAQREFTLADIKKLRKESAEKPGDAELVYQLALALIDTLQYEEAMKYMNRALELGLDTAEFHYQRVQTGFISQNFDVKNSAERLLELMPDNADAHQSMGMLLRVEEKLEEAMKHFDEALRLDPNLALAAYGKAAILNGFDRPQEALPWLDRAIELMPEYYDAYTDRAISLNNLGRPDEAVASVAAALDKGFRDMDWLSSFTSDLQGAARKRMESLIAARK